jgi:hypothetical protein
MSSGELLRPNLARYGDVAVGRRPDLQLEGADWLRSGECWVRFRCDLGKCRLELLLGEEVEDGVGGGRREMGAVA